MFEEVPWPPPGGMSLIFSQLVYINMKGRQVMGKVEFYKDQIYIQLFLGGGGGGYKIQFWFVCWYKDFIFVNE